jgi:20S proteasome subunit alpha 5
MFMTRSEYDRGVNTFSPEGRLIQVEYAIEAVKHGSTVIGIEVPEGVVLAVEKRLTSPLLEPKSIEKIMEIDSHVGCAMSGLTADARTLIDRARVECMNHRFTYNEPMDVHSITQSLCDVALRFGEEGEEDEDRMARPFGVALLMAGMNNGEPALFHMDPSGTYVRFKAKAIGSASEGAQTQLQEKYNAAMPLNEAIDLAMAVLKQVMEETLTGSNVEVGVVSASTGEFRFYNAQEIEEVISRIPESNDLI